jgi:hypothetical protein
MKRWIKPPLAAFFADLLFVGASGPAAWHPL